jgi:diaminohydroxyphosphoribosylaminopyrimidine deaminase/5-amino-6-(5-phosphoribosylamino)uracil reductase
MSTDHHKLIMERCLQLARLGAGRVAPNPMVGAVLVHEGSIIGEGYHRQYGGPHAEVECIDSVAPSNASLISRSTLYVSLEPCAHFGKTPPCADLIIRYRIPKVVIGCADPFAEVAGRGTARLREAGIEVVEGVLQDECRQLNRRFFYFHEQKRPYVVLKWAQTADGIIGKRESRLFITEAAANRVVHRWRSEEMAILVGTGTALADDPELTVRHWPGKNPLRLVIDKTLSIPPGYKLLNGKGTTIVFNQLRHTIDQGTASLQPGVHYYQLTKEKPLLPQLLEALHNLGITSVLVEGGAGLLTSFIEEGCWNEARVITNQGLHAGEGISAPQLKGHRLCHEQQLDNHSIQLFHRF